MSDEYDEHLRRAAMLYRNAVIEECALLALEWPRQEMGIALSIAVAIRKLEDKQP